MSTNTPRTVADIIANTEAAMRRDDEFDLRTETLAARRKRKLIAAKWHTYPTHAMLVAADGEILAEISSRMLGEGDKWYLPMLGVHYLGVEQAKLAVEAHIAAAA
jgi:hypothetical protein